MDPQTWPNQMTMDDIADMLGVHRNTVRAMRDKGELPTPIDPLKVPAGKRWRPHWNRSEIEPLRGPAVTS